MNKEIPICSICLEEIWNGKVQLTVMTDCGHRYHKECLDNWLKIKENCPLCREKIPPSKEEQEERDIRDRLIEDAEQRWYDAWRDHIVNIDTSQVVIGTSSTPPPPLTTPLISRRTWDLRRVDRVIDEIRSIQSILNEFEIEINIIE